MLAVVDHATGVEYRIFPLYFIPLSWIAWQRGRRGIVGSPRA